MAGEPGRRANLLDRRLLRLQHPDRPWTVRFDATLSNPVAADDLDRAIRMLMSARPDVSAGLDPSGLRWLPNRDLAVEPVVPPDAPIALDRAGLRIGLAGARRLVVDVNHGFTDGLGGVQVLRDLLTCLVGGSPPDDRMNVGDDLLRRFLDRRPRAVAGEVAGTARHVAFRPQRWPVSGATNVAAIEIPLDQLGDACPPGTAVNDALVAAVHAGVADHLGGERVSVSVPVDVRRLIGAPTGLGNAVLNASTRTIAGRRSGDDLVRAVSSQIADQAAPARLEARLGMYLLAARPGVPSTRARRQVVRWPETAVCSNLGRVDLPGVERLVFSPPAHGLVSIGVTTTATTVAVSARARTDQANLTVLLRRIVSVFD